MRLLFILIFWNKVILAQPIDSVFYQIFQTENDTERANIFYQKGFDIRNSDPEIAYKYAEASKTSALKSKSVKHIAKSYNLIGLLFYKKSNYNEAIQYLKKSLELNTKINDEYWIAINQANLGNVYSDLNYLNLAEDAYLKSLQLSNKNNNTLQITRCLINIGTIKFTEKKYEAALHQFNSAITYANKLGDMQLVATCYNNIGAIYKEQNKFDSAQLYIEESLKIKELINNEFELADSYINLASVYIKLKNYNLADNYLQLTQKLCVDFEMPETTLELYKIKSEYYEELSEYKQANYFLKKYYHLKDSLKIDITAINNNFQKNTNIPINPTNNNPFIYWIIFSFSVLAIVIPIILLQLKNE
jgi:tetratricopeptide (TPR) repeat protein